MAFVAKSVEGYDELPRVAQLLLRMYEHGGWFTTSQLREFDNNRENYRFYVNVGYRLRMGYYHYVTRTIEKVYNKETCHYEYKTRIDHVDIETIMCRRGHAERLGKAGGGVGNRPKHKLSKNMSILNTIFR